MRDGSSRARYSQAGVVFPNQSPDGISWHAQLIQLDGCKQAIVRTQDVFKRSTIAWNWPSGPFISGPGRRMLIACADRPQNHRRAQSQSNVA
jgi:hypothetical protein